MRTGQVTALAYRGKSRDHVDRRVLIEQMGGRDDAFGYDHVPAHSDPLPWIADALT